MSDASPSKSAERNNTYLCVLISIAHPLMQDADPEAKVPPLSSACNHPGNTAAPSSSDTSGGLAKRSPRKPRAEAGHALGDASKGLPVGRRSRAQRNPVAQQNGADAMLGQAGLKPRGRGGRGGQRSALDLREGSSEAVPPLVGSPGGHSQAGERAAAAASSALRGISDASPSAPPRTDRRGGGRAPRVEGAEGLHHDPEKDSRTVYILNVDATISSKVRPLARKPQGMKIV